MGKKIKIAFIKFGGIASGGSEKLLQIIAANLPRDRFDIDYFYCDTASYIGSDFEHPGTDTKRLNYMKEHRVKLIEFKVGVKDVTTLTHDWVNTDFWDYFDEKNYDIIQTSRAGHKEYPFYKIRKTPIVDIINLSAGVDNQYNISRVLHLCEWNARKWAKKGGDKNRVVIISLPIDPPKKEPKDLRTRLGLGNKFIYGFHQRDDDNIFSSIPLRAYKKIRNDSNFFLLLGGSNKYLKQARELGIIKNVYFLPHTGNQEEIYDFLATLNVYSHGRKDGEVNSQAIAEAMYFGLPIISHFSKVNNGHVECIGEAGLVVRTVEEYSNELLKLERNNKYYSYRSLKSKERFAQKYKFKDQINHLVEIYEDVYKDPFPHKFRRILSTLHYSQNIRTTLVKIFLYLKYKKFNKFKLFNYFKN